MKTNILFLTLVFLFITSCITNETEINSTENESTIKSTTPNSNQQVIKVTYPEQYDEQDMQRIRDIYFEKCYDGMVASICPDPTIVYFEVEMYNPNGLEANIEYWILTNCGTGRPGGIFDGEVDIDFEYNPY